jgi:hypothetical protein
MTKAAFASPAATSRVTVNLTPATTLAKLRLNGRLRRGGAPPDAHPSNRLILSHPIARQDTLTGALLYGRDYRQDRWPASPRRPMLT